MKLLPGWEERLGQASTSKQQPLSLPALPVSPGQYSGRTTYVDTVQAAKDMVAFCQQRSLAYVGFDFEYRYSRPVVTLDKRHTFTDPRSVEPLLLSLALVESRGHTAGATYYVFVINLSVQGMHSAIRDVLRQPVCFVGHFIQNDLSCIWKLGLHEPDAIWDTFVHEKALYLGHNHKKYKLKPGADEVDERLAEELAEKEDSLRYSLVAVCQRYGVPYLFGAAKERLQASFLNHVEGAPFTQEQIDYVAADAVAAASLHQYQIAEAASAGILSHLITVEMPWTVTNARMIWNGVRLDPKRVELTREACTRHAVALASQLQEMGLSNVNSHDQVRIFIQRLGILDLFRNGEKISFDDEHLKEVERLHPAIAMIRALRRVRRLGSDKLLTGELIGKDGRLHPEHRQVGTHTGRNSMRTPNLAGIPKPLRPLVVPDPGYGIGEVDLVQIEVGIAAAEYGDQELIRMFNGRDVYAAIARDFYAGTLPPGAQSISDAEFKRQYADKRARVKLFTLATIYNITPTGLARKLAISKQAAAAEQRHFFERFPTLVAALERTAAFGTIRGFAQVRSGLRRHRARRGRPSQWELNWLRNTPVQGSACVVFKVAGNRLDRLYQLYSARLILPMHDSYVFEAPAQQLETVANLTAEVMKLVVQEYYPQLQPQAEINIVHPGCWNKDGDSDSLERWLNDPLAT
jgi:DNA polymerase I